MIFAPLRAQKEEISMIIRKARRRDFDHIAALQIENWKDAYSEILPNTYLTGHLTNDITRHWHEAEILSKDVVLVAEKTDITGFIAVWCRPDPYIDNLHVRKNKRSQRIGTTLLILAFQELIRHGHRSVYLWVVENNIHAIRFYKKHGGIVAEHAFKDLFGHPVKSTKVVWPDISRICKMD